MPEQIGTAPVPLKRDFGLNLIETQLSGRRLEHAVMMDRENALLLTFADDEGLMRVEPLPDGRIYLQMIDVLGEELNEATGEVEAVRLDGEYLIDAPERQ